MGKGENRDKAKILALAHQVQRPALNGQIDQQPLDSHQAAIARLGRRPGADDHRALSRMGDAVAARPHVRRAGWAQLYCQ